MRDQPRLAAVERAVEEARRRLHVPGCAIAIVQNDKVICLKGFGERDVERHLPVTDQTLFAIGSCSKAFTGMIALISEDRGTISLDDSPQKYLPYFHLRDPEADAHVTLGDLLNHRSGLGEHAGDMIWSSGLFTREETIRAMGNARPTARLREKYQYNNVLHTVAGEAIARAEGATYENLVQARILGPLGMSSSSSTVPFLQEGREYALGYTHHVGTSVAQRAFLNPAAVAAVGPAGAITSNAHDMARWLRLMLGGGVFEGERFVSATRFSKLLARKSSVYLGWAYSDWNGSLELWNAGSHAGYWAEVHVLPKENLGFALLTNVTWYASPRPALPDLVREAILSKLIGKSRMLRAAATSHSAVESDSAPAVEPFQTSISVADLMSNMIAAVGGEANLRRHTSLRATYHLSIENQGIAGEGVLWQCAPDRRSQYTKLHVLGKPLGSYHAYCDGIDGGMDASPSIGSFNIGPLTGLDLANVRTSAAFPDLLDWKTRFTEVSIVRTDTVVGEEVYVVQKVPAEGNPVVDYISTHSFLVLRRDDPDWGTTLFRDYRLVEGVLLPHVWVQQIAGQIIGDWTFSVQEIEFNVSIREEEFQTWPVA